MKRVTTNEYIVMNAIVHHEMTGLNGDTPESYEEDTGTYCWVDDFTGDVLTMSQVKGVISSLVKKGLLTVRDEGPGEHNTCNLTREGFDAWQSIHRDGGIR